MAKSGWTADVSARLARRLGDPPDKLGTSQGNNRCPDIWELDNGDIAVVGRDLTAHYAEAMPGNLRIGAEERLVVIPRATFESAAKDGADA